MAAEIERLADAGFVTWRDSQQVDLLADASAVLPRGEERREETEKRRNGGSPQMREAKEAVKRQLRGEEAIAPRIRKP